MDDLEVRSSIYSVYVEAISATEARRQSVSTFSIGAISILFGTMGAANSFDELYFLIPILAISALWLAKLNFFAKLAKAKWDVVIDLEKKLPVSPFSDEWMLIKSKRSDFLYIGPSKLERAYPIMIIVIIGIYLAWRHLPECFC